MNWKHALLALALIPLAVSCSSRERSAEIPDGTPIGRGGSETPQDPNQPRRSQQATREGQRPAGWLSRSFGNNNDPNVGPCPLMGVLHDSARIVEFASPEQRYANIAFTGEMRGVRGFCRYTGADPIEMNLEIDMAFGRGPASAGARTHRYRYWVAVTRRGVAPIEKEYFNIEVEFDGDRNIATGTDQIERIVIPRANAEISGENFEVLVGFDLTPEQLAFNREGRRFRIDAGNNTQQQQ